ncbi:hypothetical protein [Pseudarthrobacter sp. NS4]|uniref:hypothetical protein n=1 Tax=Pseudarthrobacter sp. NS4 TaxID=2973976 RepID=UPI0021638996|nr:hypothetical protein [Pseudarthrobacter sp. NS4]
MLFLIAGTLDTETQTTFPRKAGMFRIYFPAMLLLVVAGIALAASATAMPGLAAGLALLTVGAGGVSAGLVTRNSKRPARHRRLTARQIEAAVMKKRIPRPAAGASIDNL